MSYGKLNRSARGAANANPPVLVLDTIEAFWEEAQIALAKVVYLTATSAPPVEPLCGRTAGAYCLLLSFKLTPFDVCYYAEPLDATEMDMVAQPDAMRAKIEARLEEVAAAAQEGGVRVRRGRWEVVAP